MGLTFVQTDGAAPDGLILDGLNVACTGIAPLINYHEELGATINGTAGTTEYTITWKKGADGIFLASQLAAGDYDWQQGAYQCPIHVYWGALNPFYLEGVYICRIRSGASVALVGFNVCHTFIPANVTDTTYWTQVVGAAQPAAQAGDSAYICYRLKGYGETMGTIKIQHNQNVSTMLELISEQTDRRIPRGVGRGIIRGVC